MGWASATTIVEEIIKSAKRYIPDQDKRKAMYKDIIIAFEDMDWDTQDECLGMDKAFDSAMKEIHPDWDIWE